MIRPFDENSVVYRFIPTIDEKRKSGQIFAEECVLVQDNSSYLICWQRHTNGSWIPGSPYLFLSRFLKERDDLRVECDKLRMQLQQQGGPCPQCREQGWQITQSCPICHYANMAYEYAERYRVTWLALRDMRIERDKLACLAVDKDTAALEQGKKLRRES